MNRVATLTLALCTLIATGLFAADPASFQFALDPGSSVVLEGMTLMETHHNAVVLSASNGTNNVGNCTIPTGANAVVLGWGDPAEDYWCHWNSTLCVVPSSSITDGTAPIKGGGVAYVLPTGETHLYFISTTANIVPLTFGVARPR